MPIAEYRPPKGTSFARDMVSAPVALMERVIAMREPIVKARSSGFTFWVVSDGELARSVLQTDESSFVRPFAANHLFRVVSGANLFTTRDAKWAWRRSALHPGFQRDPMRDALPIIADAIDVELNRWPCDQRMYIQPLTMRIALASAARAMFGAQLTDADIDTELASIDTVANWIMNRMGSLRSLPLIVPTRTNREMRAARRDVAARLTRMTSESNGQHGDTATLLQLLLEARDPATDRPLTQEQVISESFGLLFAGHETTAAAAAWTLALLARHPEEHARVRTEVQAVLGDEKVTADDIPQLKYTRAVIDEALRLYPPAWGTPRMARRTTHVGSTRVRRGNIVLVAVYAMHRSPLHWDDPEAFRPERFLANGRASIQYQPFSVGPRQCLGMRFALTELVILIARVSQRFDFVTSDEELPEPTTTFALRADRCQLTLSERAP